MTNLNSILFREWVFSFSEHMFQAQISRNSHILLFEIRKERKAILRLLHTIYLTPWALF